MGDPATTDDRAATWTAQDEPAARRDPAVPRDTAHEPAPDAPDEVAAPRHPPGEHETAALPTAPRLDLPRWPRRWLTRALVVLSVLATGAYVGWWLAPGHIGNPVLFALLAAAETYTVAHVVGLWQLSWSPQVRLPPPGTSRHTVDVLIPTYGEELDVLRRTVAAAVAMDGAHRTWVLDDAVRDEVRELADRLGARYVPRSSSTGAKAGNLNHALERADGDLIVVFDADHVPRRDFLTHLLGYFEDPEVGIVQTPQFYGNAIDNPVARGAWLQQTPFYGPILRGKQGTNAVFLCGTNAILRREALDDAGGFDEDSVVEDLVTSLRMQRRGWKVVYFPFVLAEGEGPSTLRAYLSQQLRWARGNIGALLHPLRPGHGGLQRVQNLYATSYYLIGLAIPIYLSLPVLGLAFGLRPFDLEARTFPLFFVPHLVLALWLIHRGLRGRFSLANTRFTFGAYPVYLTAIVTGVFGAEASFTATASEEERRPPLAAWVTVATWVAIAAAAVAGPLLRGLDTWSWVSLFWAGLNLYLLWPITALTLRESFGADEPPGDEPQVPGDHEGEDEFAPVPTYVLGRYRYPPLPEDVLA